MMLAITAARRSNNISFAKKIHHHLSILRRSTSNNVLVPAVDHKIITCTDNHINRYYGSTSVIQPLLSSSKTKVTNHCHCHCHHHHHHHHHHYLHTNSNEQQQQQNFNDEQQHNEANERYLNILNINGTPNKGYGLFALKDFHIGDLIMTSGRSAKITTTRCSHSVQIDWNKHILMDLPAILINHSCNANVGIRNHNTTTTTNNDDDDDDDDEHAATDGGYDFWAIRPIIKGEELTWDYEATEWELSTPFRCNCGSKNCRHILKGFKHNGDIIQKQYGEYYANYLKEKEK
jgi:hypothetical protein